MSYLNEQLAGALVPNGAGVLSPDDLSAAAVHGEYLVMDEIELSRIMAMVSTVTVGACTVQFKKRLGPGVTAGETVMGELILPGGSAVAEVLYKDIDPVKLEPGQAIAFEISSAATSGGAVYGFRANLCPEDARNQENMVLSA